jgi:hypothetical protein
MHRWFLVFILVWIPLSFGQATPQTRDQLRDETAKNIAALYQKYPGLFALTPHEKELQAACAVNCSAPQVQAELSAANARIVSSMDEVALQMERAIDNYIVRTVNPKHADLDRQLVAQDLKQILGEVAVGAPSAFVLDSPHGRSLIVAYTLGKGFAMGPGATSVVLRSYHATDKGLKVGDTTGEDMDGYANVSVKTLPSPVPGQIWFLLWGQATGANGPNIRMRGYAYDGSKFRTVWMPANEWGNFTIRVDTNGFTIDGEYYRNGKKRHDVYTLAPDSFYLEDLRN